MTGLEPYFVNLHRTEAAKLLYGPHFGRQLQQQQEPKRIVKIGGAFEIKRRRRNQNITFVCFQCNVMSLQWNLLRFSRNLWKDLKDKISYLWRVKVRSFIMKVRSFFMKVRSLILKVRSLILKVRSFIMKVRSSWAWNKTWCLCSTGGRHVNQFGLGTEKSGDKLGGCSKY